MKVGIATDHNGVNEKKVIIERLTNLGYQMIDLSPNNYDTDDYPDFAYSVAKKVVNKNIDLGILLCGTGIGMSIAANKVKCIRCAHVSNIDEARLCRNHNNANIIALSYKLDIEMLIEIINAYLTSEFLYEERHVRRIKKIEQIEENTFEVNDEC